MPRASRKATSGPGGADAEHLVAAREAGVDLGEQQVAEREVDGGEVGDLHSRARTTAIPAMPVRRRGRDEPASAKG